MENIDRRTALAFVIAAASTAALGEKAQAQTADASKDLDYAPGVKVRAYGEAKSIIPGFKTAKVYDVIMQPGSKTPEASSPMTSALICQMIEGELRLLREGKDVIVKMNEVWTCNVGTNELGFNDTKAVAVMRVIDLAPA
jgi:quercetin dioxygenase-like cupin family protein